MPAPMTPDSMSNNSMSMKDMVMHMSFFWGKDPTVLFEGWPNGRLGMYVLALVFVFFLALAVELLSLSPSLAKAGASPVLTSLTHSAVYAVHIALAYMVMLSVMSFNLGIFIVAVAGHTVGHFLVKLRRIAAGASGNTADEFLKV